jgi:fumarylacetoacetase
MTGVDHTHDERARSWVASANAPSTGFPIQNLPLAIFHAGTGSEGRIGVAIGDQILDLGAVLDRGLNGFLQQHERLLRANSLNGLMAAGRPVLKALRGHVFGLLVQGCAHEDRVRECLVPMSSVRMGMPAQIGDFTDFFTSIHHARRTGELSRPDMPVAPNFRSLPIAYHGRASTVVESGVPCIRPKGQAHGASGDTRYVPTQRLDFELEVGCFVGPGNALGDTIPLDEAESHVAGLCLVNDWSARDIQRWESVPLGPFLAKSFMTSISPWVVTLEALAPFRVPAPSRPAEDPALSPTLTSPLHQAQGAIDIALEVLLQTGKMKRDGIAPMAIARPLFAQQYWTLFQMLTHHASNGCSLRPGDLISSGTVSGPEREDSGCLLELTVGGREPLTLPSGEARTFLEDGDTVLFRGVCRRDGYRSIGFGECEAQIAKEKA